MNRIRKVLKGGLVSLIMIMMICSQTALAAYDHQELSGLSLPQQMSLEAAKNGIVRVEAGVLDDNRKFKKKNTSSGFIACSGSNGVYIVTTYHTVNTGDDPAIRIVVKNDTTIEARIENFSKEHDYCILRADGAMNDKSAIPLRILDYDGEAKLNNGDPVISLGFAASAGAGTEFSAADVTEQKGEIKDVSYSNGKATYIEHTATVADGLDGGVLVDENGYVIGLNNAKVKGDAGCFCALDIIEVDKLLDSSGIEHRTKDKDELYTSLYNICNEALDNYKTIKKSDQKELYKAVVTAATVMGEAPYDREALQKSYDAVSSKYRGAERKTSKLLILIIALGAVILFLGIRLITLIVWNRKNGGTPPASKPKKEKKGKKDKKSKAGSATAVTPAAPVTRATPATPAGHASPSAHKKGKPVDFSAPGKGATGVAAASWKRPEPSDLNPYAAPASSWGTPGPHAAPASHKPYAAPAAPEANSYFHAAPSSLDSREPMGYSQPQMNAAPAGPGYAMNMPKLILRNSGKIIPLQKNIITIGRSPEADLTIPDDIYVAKIHAMIENRMGMHFIRDMGTKNGVYLNGSRLGDQAIRLAPGDIITLGTQKIEFRVD